MCIDMLYRPVYMHAYTFVLCDGDYGCWSDYRTVRPGIRTRMTGDGDVQRAKDRHRSQPQSGIGVGHSQASESATVSHRPVATFETSVGNAMSLEVASRPEP